MRSSLLRSIVLTTLTALALLLAGGWLLGSLLPAMPQAAAQGPLVPPPLRTRAALPAPPLIALPLLTPTVAATPQMTVAPAAVITPTATDTIAGTAAAVTDTETSAAPLVLTPTATLNSSESEDAPPLLLPTVTPTAAAGTAITNPATADIAATDVATGIVATDTVTTDTVTTNTVATSNAVALPTPTSTPTPDAAATRLVIELPDTLASGYRAQGSYSSQTVYPDGQISQQQGTFAIIQAPADNDYGSNQTFTLTSRTEDGQTDSIAVFLVDDYIAIHYNDAASPDRVSAAASTDDWVIVQRSAGSSLVKAIQPITDLAALLPQLADQAGSLDQAEIDGQPALHMRLDDLTLIGDQLLRPLLGTRGEIRSFKLDAWLTAPQDASDEPDDGPSAADPDSYVIRYTFQLELEGARVLDATFEEVSADQAVAWTYQVVEVDDSLEVAWPDAAPQPGVVNVPGFANGAFPLPSNAEWIGLANGVPEVLAPQPQAAVATFYRDLLTSQGWTVSGGDAFLRCTKDSDLFQLLLMEDEETGGTRISVLTGAALGDGPNNEPSADDPSATP